MTNVTFVAGDGGWTSESLFASLIGTDHVLTGINGSAASANEYIELSDGVRILIGRDGKLYLDPTNDFAGLGAGETETLDFSLTVTDAEGNETTRNVTLTVEGDGVTRFTVCENDDAFCVDVDTEKCLLTEDVWFAEGENKLATGFGQMWYMTDPVRVYFSARIELEHLGPDVTSIDGVDLSAIGPILTEIFGGQVSQELTILRYENSVALIGVQVSGADPLSDPTLVDSMMPEFLPIVVDFTTSDGRSHTVDFGVCPTDGTQSPIAFDLNMNGEIDVTGQSTAKGHAFDENADTVWFDIDNDGYGDNIEWLDGSGDGLLIDTNLIGPGNAVDGEALFGDEGGSYADGYAKLSALRDTDQNGVVEGAELDGLGIWVDDGDGVLENGEVVALAEVGISELSTESEQVNVDGEWLARSRTVVDAEAVDGVVYSLEGPDAQYFQIDPSTGKLTYATGFVPDFENPQDADGDNEYDITIVRGGANCIDPEREDYRIKVENKPEGTQGSVAGTYFCDENRDNDDDGAANGDADIAGKIVTLVNPDGSIALGFNGEPIAAVRTDAMGNYRFEDIPPGDYRVHFEAVDGKEFIEQDASGNGDADDSDVDPNTGSTPVFTLSSGEDKTDVDAGVREPVSPGSLSGTYFCDEDRDDTDDGAANGDADVAGKTVTLLNADGTPATDIDGNLIAPVLTDAEGNYRFDNLAAGEYKVRFEAEADKEFVAQDNSPNGDADDSDVDPTNGMTGTVSVTEGEETSDVDAGVRYLPGSLSGTYFCDENRDDTDDGAANGDADVVGKTVTLLNADGSPATDIDGNLIAPVLTDAEGNYRFGNLAAGEYKVQFEAEADKEFVAQDNSPNGDADDSDVDPANGMTGTVTVNAGEETPDVDAGVRYLPGSLSGTYFCDEDRDGVDDGAANGDADIVGRTVTLLNVDGTPATDIDGDPVAAVQTDAEGNYRFDNLAAGEYVVKFAKPTYKRFIEANASPNGDADDSDVINAGTGTTAPVTVNAGEETTDVDAGVERRPGALAGTYFCDVDLDNVDDGSANGDLDVAGRLVTLLNADGTPAVDYDGNLVQPLLTGANGNYKFTNLAPGQYRVQFELEPGKEFVDPDVGTDNRIDSDVDPATGITGLVTVKAGRTAKHVDAGVREGEQAPTPEDDAAITCYDEAVTVDALANDTDPNGDALTITHVNGVAISEGGAAIDLGGVSVTLVGGELVFDGAVAHADLLSGEEATEQFEYTVSDGNGGSATATVAVTFCGATDTLAKVEGTLPGSVTFQVVDENLPAGSSPDAYTLLLSGTTDGRLAGQYENAYCISVLDPLNAGQFGSDITQAPLVTADVELADEDLASTMLDGQVGINGVTAEQNLDLVNWIMNQDYESVDNGDGTSTTYTDAEIQGAIWALTDGELLEQYGYSGGIFVAAGSGTTQNAQEIVDAALANGEGYEASQPGDLVGIVLDPTDPAGHQPFIIGIDLFEECIC